MLLYHVSPRRNRKGILARGLLTRKSKGKLQAVWLVAENMVEWAILHVHGRHKAAVERIDVFPVEAAFLTATRSGRPGLFYVRDDVQAEYLSPPVPAEDWWGAESDADSEEASRLGGSHFPPPPSAA